jgi:hypothetical protein
VSLGALNLAPSRLDNVNTFFTPTVSQAGGQQNVSPARLNNAQTFFEHTIQVQERTSLSKADIDAIADAVWARTLPIGNPVQFSYGTGVLTSADLAAISQAVWLKELPENCP